MSLILMAHEGSCMCRTITYQKTTGGYHPAGTLFIVCISDFSLSLLQSSENRK